MKDCSHARHSLSRSRVQLLDFAICNRRFDRSGVEQVRKMEIRSVHGGTANFEWTIDVRLRCADFGCLGALRHDSGLLYAVCVTNYSECMTVRFANSSLNGFCLCGVAY